MLSLSLPQRYHHSPFFYYFFSHVTLVGSLSLSHFLSGGSGCHFFSHLTHQFIDYLQFSDCSPKNQPIALTLRAKTSFFYFAWIIYRNTYLLSESAVCFSFSFNLDYYTDRTLHYGVVDFHTLFGY